MIRDPLDFTHGKPHHFQKFMIRNVRLRLRSAGTLVEFLVYSQGSGRLLLLKSTPAPAGGIFGGEKLGGKCPLFDVGPG